MTRKYNVGIVGATGAVGHELMKVLAERNFPYQELRMLASARSVGKKIEFNGQEYTVGLTDANAFDGLDIVLFAGGEASKLYAHDAVKAGAIVIDNSSSFRYDPAIPLVVPEVNPEDLTWHKGIIANPNCSTIQMVVALKPLHDYAKIKRIVVSTYQATSGAGAEGIAELMQQLAELANGQPISDPKFFAHQIACNLIPHIDVWQDNDYTKEEMKMTWETQKMFHDQDIKLSATAVRVPVLRSHSEAINIETEKPLSAEKARELLANAPGIKVMDQPRENIYPMPYPLSDTDTVYVGRIRKDISCDNGLVLWVVADQLRKGAATNAIQIAEKMIEMNLI